MKEYNSSYWKYYHIQLFSIRINKFSIYTNSLLILHSYISPYIVPIINIYELLLLLDMNVFGNINIDETVPGNMQLYLIFL